MLVCPIILDKLDHLINVSVVGQKMTSKRNPYQILRTRECEPYLFKPYLFRGFCRYD